MIRLARRDFMRTVGAAAGCGLTTSLGWPQELVADSKGDLDVLAGWLTEIPRDRLLEQIVDRIREGLSHELLASAITQAAARSVQPYPHVGFKYHTVMVMQAVYRASVRLPDLDRWLPLIWAADYFKRSQATELRQSGWRMPKVNHHPLVSNARARQFLVGALNDWDREAADAAVVSYADVASSNEVFDLMFRYAARDFRDIGHKAITVCNAHRMLAPMGWMNKEPLLRSLVAALQNHDDQPNPAVSPGKADRAWHHNRERVDKLPDHWEAGTADPEAMRDLLDVLRHGNDIEASDRVFALLRRGVAPESLWEAILVMAGELMLRRSGIFSVHANTTVHAMHYAYRTTVNSHTRALVLLQCASFMPGFRGLLPERQRNIDIDRLQPLPLDNANDDPLGEIFANVSDDRMLATRKILGYLQAGGNVDQLMARARHFVVYNNTGAHDYKFTEALFENAVFVRPPLQAVYLASGSLYYNGSKDRQNSVIAQVLPLLRG